MRSPLPPFPVLAAFVVAHAAAIAARAEVAGAPEAVPLFLGERIVLVPEDPDPSPGALPTVVLRTEADSRAFFITLDCDARNLVTLGREGPTFRAAVVFFPEMGGPTHVRYEIDGSSEPGPLVVAGLGDPPPLFPSPGDWEVTLEFREDGNWRVNARIPREAWPVVEGETSPLGLQVEFGLPTHGDGEEPAFGSAGRLVLMPDAPAGMEFHFRRATAADMSDILRSYTAAASESCERRCLNRLFRLGSRDEALRGALVMAMEHEDATLREASARLWLWWPDESPADLEKIRLRARDVLGLPPPDEPEERNEEETEQDLRPTE